MKVKRSLTRYQGVVSGMLISPDFIKVFPETEKADIQGITASCFSVGNISLTTSKLTFNDLPRISLVICLAVCWPLSMATVWEERIPSGLVVLSALSGQFCSSPRFHFPN